MRLEFYLSKAGWMVRVWSTSRANALCHWGLSGSKNFTRRDKNISHSVTCKVMRERNIKLCKVNKAWQNDITIHSKYFSVSGWPY